MSSESRQPIETTSEDDLSITSAGSAPVDESVQDTGPAEKQIRVLNLLPGSGDDPIRCEIFDNQSIEEIAGKYLALSYCAGDYRNTMEITVNNRVFNAFASLGEALRRIRLTEDFLQGRPHLVWTDQICINQSDKSERSHQVMQMRAIYQNSGRVMVWLGPQGDKESLNFLMNHYDNITMIFDSVNKRKNLEENDSVSEHSGDGASEDLHREPVVNSSADGSAAGSPEVTMEAVTSVFAASLLERIEDEEFVAGWKSLGDIASSQWWSRAWICQEIIVAHTATIMCGPAAMDWKQFTTVWPLMKEALPIFLQAFLDKGSYEHLLIPILQECPWISNFPRISLILKTQDAWAKSDKRDIKRLLEASRSCQVTDPRDRIYAFLGLADPDYMIDPDYEVWNTLADTFTYTCKRIILFEQSLDILRYSQETERTLGNDLPSWVPDWSSENPSRHDVQFRASADCKSTAAFIKGPLGSPDRCLRVQCLIIDQVANHNTLGNRGGSDRDLDTTKREWISILERHVRNKRPIKSSNVTDDFMATIWQDSGIDTEEGDLLGLIKNPDKLILDSQRKYLAKQTLSGDWRYFISPKGFMGLAKFRAQATDKICILLGASVPFVLRKVDDHYLLVGEAYIRGLMGGEAIIMMQKEEVKVETIDIW
ncbi:heterokaryon incompatibility protein-domain-containing protein [Hyaloscypha finlandica]|nr:heterokaryon incompatibility protein-domain-containing protein [Hyaloscypha finlandica]